MSVADDIEQVYRKYAAFGRSSAGDGLTSSAFVKIMKDCKLVGKKLTTIQLDLIFTRCLPSKKAKKINLEGFFAALHDCAETRGTPLNDFLTVIANASPKTNATQAQSRFYDDQSTWTGVATRGGPTTIDNHATADISNFLDRSTDYDVRGVKKSAYQSGGTYAAPTGTAEQQEATQAAAAGAAAPTSSGNRRRLSAHGLNMLMAATQEAAADQPPAPPAPPAAPLDYRALLSNYFAQYNPAKMANVDTLLETFAGREMELFDKMYEKYGAPVIPEQAAPTSQQQAPPPPPEVLRPPPAASQGGPSIFDKLTDSSLYTGHHKQRFDADGQGRGLAGRDPIMKGSGHMTATKAYSGSTTDKSDTIYHDSSQFLMRR